MKMGDFCRETGLTPHTARYYIKMGLLVPQRKNGQYVFNEESLSDMRIISALKSYLFSLEEIHAILSLYRLSHIAAPNDAEKLSGFFEKKAEEVRGLAGQSRRMLDNIKTVIQKMELDGCDGNA